MKDLTPTAAIRDYFGQKPGQSLKEFVEEIKALSPEDKHELASLTAKELGGNLVG